MIPKKNAFYKDKQQVKLSDPLLQTHAHEQMNIIIQMLDGNGCIWSADQQHVISINSITNNWIFKGGLDFHIDFSLSGLVRRKKWSKEDYLQNNTLKE